MTEFAIALCSLAFVALCIGLIYAFNQFAQTARKVESFLDHLDREIMPVVRQVEFLTRDLDDLVKNSNRQVSRLETSLALLEDVAGEVSTLKNNVMNQANKSAVLGFVAALLGLFKGREMFDKFKSKHRKA